MNYSIRYNFNDIVSNKVMRSTRVITAADPQAAEQLAQTLLPDLVKITQHVRGTLAISEIVPLG